MHTISPAGMGPDTLRLVTVNCNGLRRRKRRLALGHLLAVLKVDICVVTESHLRKGDLGWLKGNDFPEHAVIASFCRRAKNRKIGGGVVIMAHKGLTVVKRKDGEGDGEAVEVCSVHLHPERNESLRIRISGVYMPPSRTGQITEEHLREIGGDCSGAVDTSEEPHLILGDFNPTTWMEMYEEWRCDRLIWQLTDPLIPTHTGGGALDRVLLRPGLYTPEDWLPTQEVSLEEERYDRQEDTLYPAEAQPSMAFSDHYPVFLAMPWGRGKEAKVGKRLALDGLEPEV